MRSEEWRTISEYEGIYEVSSHGNIRSITREVTQVQCGVEVVRCLKGRSMRKIDNGNGYLYVTLSRDNARKNHYIHRLVAEAFLPKTEGAPVINHKDYNKHNNKVTNLEWCSQLENIRHSAIHMHKPRKVCRSTNTGEKYISARKQRNGSVLFRVCIRPLGVDRGFPTLDEAVQFKKSVLTGVWRED